MVRVGVLVLACQIFSQALSFADKAKKKANDDALVIPDSVQLNLPHKQQSTAIPSVQKKIKQQPVMLSTDSEAGAVFH